MSDLPALLEHAFQRSTPEPPAPAPAEQAPETGAAPADPAAPEPQPAASAEVEKLSAGDQARAAAGQAFRSARRKFKDARRAEGGLVHGLLTSKGPSVEEQIAYKRSKAWVPTGHDGGIADGLGTWYHKWIAIPGVALGQSWLGIVCRPYRMAVAFGLFALTATVAVCWIFL